MDMAYRCNCLARCRVCKGTNYIGLEFHGTNDETSHAKERSMKVTYKQSTAIHEAMIVLPHQSATKLRFNVENASPDKRMPQAHLSCAFGETDNSSRYMKFLLVARYKSLSIYFCTLGRAMSSLRHVVKGYSLVLLALLGIGKLLPSEVYKR